MTTLTVFPTIDYIDQLLAEAEASKYENHAYILQLAAEIIDIAQQAGDFRRFAEGLLHQAWANVMLNRYEPALTSAMEALMLARQHGFGEIEARAIGTIGVTFTTTGLVDESRLLLEQQLRLAEEIRNRELQAMALNQIAFSMLGTTQAKGAAALLQHALAIIPADSHRGLDRALILTNLSQTWAQDGRYREAVAAAKEALRTAELVGCTPVITTIHLSLSATHLTAENLELSATHLDQARIYIDQDVFTPNHIKIELALGNFLAAQGLYTDAIDVLERAYDLSIQNRMIDMAVYSLNAIKEMHERLDDLLGVVVVYRRLTEDIVHQQQHYANLRLKVLAMVFAQDKAAVQADLRIAQQKYAIVQNLSSEFCTPLAVIQTSAQLIERQADRMNPTQRKKHLQNITGQVKEMAQMLENVTRLLGEDAPTHPTLPARLFSLNTLVFLVLGRLDDYGARADRVRVTLSPHESEIRVPVETLEPILIHLLTNALKFSHDEVHLHIKAEEGKLTVQVVDQGIGIPSGETSRIFQPMVRGSNLEEPTGAGLGLAVVSKLIRQMHGSIDLVSAEGEGTIITVKIPL